MKYVIDIKSHTPAYQQLYLQVREDIIKGIYPMGSKLPSKRTIALDSNTSTVYVSAIAKKMILDLVLVLDVFLVFISKSPFVYEFIETKKWQYGAKHSVLPQTKAI